MYAKIVDNRVVEYPVNPFTDNPNVSFPLDWVGGEINGLTYTRIARTDPPIPPLGWYVTEGWPVKVNGVWSQFWETALVSEQDLKNVVAYKRYEVETGGVRINNHLFSTDRESQTKYVAIAVDISQTTDLSSWSITWKTKENTFITLNSVEMTQVINGVRDHIQRSFNKEAEYVALIDSSDQATLEATDFSAGWPSNT